MKRRPARRLRDPPELPAVRIARESAGARHVGSLFQESVDALDPTPLRRHRQRGHAVGVGRVHVRVRMLHQLFDQPRLGVLGREVEAREPRRVRAVRADPRLEKLADFVHRVGVAHHAVAQQHPPEGIARRLRGRGVHVAEPVAHRAREPQLGAAIGPPPQRRALALGFHFAAEQHVAEDRAVERGLLAQERRELRERRSVFGRRGQLVGRRREVQRARRRSERRLVSRSGRRGFGGVLRAFHGRQRRHLFINALVSLARSSHAGRAW